MRNPIVVVAEKWRGWSAVQKAVVLVFACVVLVVTLLTEQRPARILPKSAAVSAFPPTSYQTEAAAEAGTEGSQLIDDAERKQLQANAATTREELKKDLDARGQRLMVPGAPGAGPLIAHTAELAVATKEFLRSRTSLEEILERHRGYTARLRMIGQKSGSVLSATLRVPSTELSETVSDLKALGDVEREEQAADEITQQRADLEARLSNAQKTLKRLEELLQKQTYPDGNVRELQRQIANANSELAHLEAERQASEHRVIFANVFFTLREEVAKPSESLGAQLRGAAAAGFADAVTSLAGLMVFLIGRGPVLVLWCAILFVPARFAWKKWAPVGASASAATAGN